MLEAVTNKARWHTQLLRRMTLDVEGIRPRVIGDETYRCLNELRRFRHLFRNAYVLRFDPERAAIVLKDARRLERLYKRDAGAVVWAGEIGTRPMGEVFNVASGKQTGVLELVRVLNGAWER